MPWDRTDCDHDWRLVSDWGGDSGVIGGTFDCSFARCRACGEESHDAELVQALIERAREPLEDDFL